MDSLTKTGLEQKKIKNQNQNQCDPELKFGFLWCGLCDAIILAFVPHHLSCKHFLDLVCFYLTHLSILSGFIQLWAWASRVELHTSAHVPL